MLKPIPEWRSAWRMASVRVAVLAVAWLAVPDATQASILRMLGLTEAQLPAVLGVLFIAARLIAQPALHPPPEP